MVEIKKLDIGFRDEYPDYWIVTEIIEKINELIDAINRIDIE